MPISGHLNELRKCILIIIVTFLVTSVAGYFVAPFLVRYTMDLAQHYRFIQTGVAELMALYIKVGLITGIVATLPVTIWQIDRFLRPGLKKSENRAVLLTMIGGSLLFFGAAAFCIWVIIPFTLSFFLKLNTIGLLGLYSIKEYFSYVLSFIVAFGVIFELPVAVALLTRIGALKPKYMIKGQRIIIVVCFILGAIITPPDVVSQVMVALPMILLYEASIIVCKIIYNRRKAHLAAEGIDLDDTEDKQDKERLTRWQAAKAAVEKADREKNR